MKLTTLLLIALAITALLMTACSPSEAPAKQEQAQDTPTLSESDVTDTIDTEIVGEDDSVEIGELI